MSIEAVRRLELEVRVMDPASISSELVAFFTRSGLPAHLSGTPLKGFVFCCIDADSELQAAAYITPPEAVWVGLADAGMPLEQIKEAGVLLQGLNGIAVSPHLRGEGLGAELLQIACLESARRLGAQHILARLDAKDLDLQNWYKRQGFRVAEPGAALKTDGFLLPHDPDYCEAWKTLTGFPRYPLSVAS